jgi:hypothetical protein
MGVENSEDRRKQQRTPVIRGIAAVLNTTFYHVGPLIDISQKGLAMSYCNVTIVPDESVVVDILIMGEKDVYLRRVPGRVVSACDLPENLSAGTKQSRRCSICFNDLTRDQETELHHFIEANTFPTA